MSKRFTDTNKWNKGWIHSLDPKYKLLWVYLIDMCNHAGIWDCNLELASFQLGIDYDLMETIKVFEDKIEIIDSGNKWFISSFIHFQYGELNESNRVHLSVINILKKEGAYKGLTSPMHGAKDKDKGKAKAKNKDKDTVLSDKQQKEKKESLKRNKEMFEDLWDIYPKKQKKEPSRVRFKTLSSDEELFSEIVRDVTERSKSYEWRKRDGKFVPLLSSYLHQKLWTDDMFPVDAPASEVDESRMPYNEPETPTRF